MIKNTETFFEELEFALNSAKMNNFKDNNILSVFMKYTEITKVIVEALIFSDAISAKNNLPELLNITLSDSVYKYGDSYYSMLNILEVNYDDPKIVAKKIKEYETGDEGRKLYMFCSEGMNALKNKKLK